MTKGWVLGWVGLGLVVGGCGGAQESDAPPGEESSAVSELRSAEPRVLASETEAGLAARAEQALGFDFLHALPADENLALSPHSLNSAFAMLTDAAEGETLTELQQVLHFGEVGEPFHRSQDALQLALAKRNRDPVDLPDQKTDAQVLTESNDLWMREDAPPQASYLDTLARYYGAGVHLADFGENPEGARRAINDKISTDTRALIPELIPEGAIDPLTVAVLTNALYFKAPWASKLREVDPTEFHLLSGATKRVDTLVGRSSLPFYQGEGFVSVALPYFGTELEMLLVVPDAGTYEDVRTALSAPVLSQIVSERQAERIDLQLPKFSIRSTIPAKKLLEGLGLGLVFKRDAELPKLESPLFPDVFVSDVLHQATVAIDEVGTEASAATAIIAAGLSSSDPEPEPRVVNVDRPFSFMIRDNPTGSVLFVGQVVEP